MIICINKRTFYDDNGHETTVLVVLAEVEGGPNYAAYMGVGTPEHVAAHGAKLQFAEARCHFPLGLEEARYRGL